MSKKHLLLMGQYTPQIKGRLTLTWLKDDGEDAREPKGVIAFTDAMAAAVARGYAITEKIEADEGVYTARLVKAIPVEEELTHAEVVGIIKAPPVAIGDHHYQ